MFSPFYTSLFISVSLLLAMAKAELLKPPLCDVQNFGYAEKPYVNDGISYLRRHGGTCQANARSCARVSCSYNAAIYLCNDLNYEVLPDCSTVADMAQNIADDCTVAEGDLIQQGHHPGGYTYWVQGQQFNLGDGEGHYEYNVIVDYDRC